MRRPSSETFAELSEAKANRLSESFGTMSSEIKEKNAKRSANNVTGRPFINRLLVYNCRGRHNG